MEEKQQSPRTGRRTFADTYPQGLQLSQETVSLLERKNKKREALTFDEVTLEDKPSMFHPNEVNVRSFITRKISLKSCGILSAAMDTVTEQEMALAMAKNGGIGVLHRNLDAQAQAQMVKWIRKKINSDGMIDKPITFRPNDYYSYLQKEVSMRRWTFTSFPVVDEAGKLLGLITRDEMDFVNTDDNPKLGDIMKKLDQIITAPEDTSSNEAYKIMKEKKVKKLPVVAPSGELKGMYVWGDLKRDVNNKDKFSLDDEGHFLVAAAIGLGKDDIARAELLVANGCRVLVLDSSHGACKPAKEQIRAIRAKLGDSVEIIAGNIASYDSAMYLLEDEQGARPDALKVGIGPGSICTTRSVTGHGIPQVTAIFQVWRAVQDFGKKTGYYVPIIADGGVRSSGDIVKCLASGASAVMLGSMLAGTEESPGLIIMKNGKSYKTIRGMGSRAAMESRSGSRGRYYRDGANQAEELTTGQAQKMVPEGVEGLVEYKGSVVRVLNVLVGGIQAGLAHTGAGDIATFQKQAALWTQGFAGIAEGNPHDITDVRN
ncbi:Inosine5'-monophosphate dehydrogenase [Acanthamoeba castellanii str. Neff]|uniref:Inosine5'-monophosphate dehydrogenase n=1 Tax=Acanthamoeba castellanii (strain ATCC 30010 / Neff) TaxID=1257118 RepID=L8HGD4_ACACF|nr:Inosine5'-monophosphate dehydrogenase [Acanthamoeba castellanii str. Neff]ELR24205.1 Inosine5'-monophosphate dehydrogenase [Acanthamoeba castellanii str. Neff]